MSFRMTIANDKTSGASNWCARALCGLILLTTIIVSAASRAAETTEFDQGIKAFNDGSYAEAIIFLRNTVQAEPNNLSARIYLGRAFNAAGQYLAAEYELSRALQQGGDPNLVVVPLAESHLKQGKFQELVEGFQYSQLDYANKAELYLLKGFAYLRLNNVEEADQMFDLSARSNPESASPILARATIALNGGKLDKAEELLEYAQTKQRFNNAEIWELKGKVATYKGKLDVALDAYDKALELEPDRQSTRLAKSSLLLSTGKTDQALAIIESIYSEDLFDAETTYYYALALTQKGKFREARSLLERTNEILTSLDEKYKTSYPSLLMLSALVSYQNGYLNQALKDAKAARQLWPGHPFVQRLLAQIQLSMGNSREALSLLKPLYRSSGDDPSYLSLYGKVLLQNERFDEAAQVLARAVELQPESAYLITDLAISKLASGELEDAKDLLGEAASIEDGGRSAVILAMVNFRNRDYPETISVLQDYHKERDGNSLTYNLMGRAFLASDDVESARRSFEQALVVDEKSTDARINLARLAARSKDYKGAIDSYTEILQSDSGNYQAMEGIAAVYRAQGNNSEAIRWLEKAREVAGTDFAAFPILMDLYLRSDLAEKGLFAAEQMLKADPGNFIAHIGLVRAQIALDRVKSARKTMQNIATLEKLDAQQLFQLARMQLQLEDAFGARLSLEKALRRNSGFTPAKLELIKIETLFGIKERALREAQELKSELEDKGIGHQIVADVLVASSRYAEAEAELEAGMRKAPSQAMLVKLIRVYLMQSKYADAVAALAPIVEKQPDNVQLLNLLAIAQLKNGELGKARTNLQKLDQLAPNSAGILNNMALLSLAENKLDEADEYAKRAYELAPFDPNILDSYGWILVQQDEAEKGLRMLREAKARNSSDAGINLHLAKALVKLERNGEAREVLQSLKAGGNADAREIEEADRLLGELN